MLAMRGFLIMKDACAHSRPSTIIHINSFIFARSKPVLSLLTVIQNTAVTWLLVCTSYLSLMVSTRAVTVAKVADS